MCWSTIHTLWLHDWVWLLKRTRGPLKMVRTVPATLVPNLGGLGCFSHIASVIWYFFFYRCERHLRNIIHFKLNTFRCKDGGFLRGIFGRIIFPWRFWRFALIQMNCLIILPVSNPHAHRFVITCNLKITFNSTQRNRLLGVIVFDPFVRPAFC